MSTENINVLNPGLQFLDNGEVIEGDSKEMCKEFGACTEDNLVIECPQGHEYRNGECRGMIC